MSSAMAPHQVLTLMVVGVCMFMQVQGARCPLGFVRHKRSCYWFSITKGSFSEARSMCRYLKSDLAKVTSKDENDFIRHFALVRGKAPLYFLGGSDVRQTGRWSWNGEEQRMIFTNWAPGEPNNHLTERCLVLWKSRHYQWADYHCHAVINYVCECPVL
ncbi:perlucin-like [Haliotis rufescens]|uniref:perlucin-like n=1 Tax=Haliotis rufescens TaxID=6454 RepID=UPI001EB0930E|nr:perlucin-like [Haliotis rufescens]